VTRSLARPCISLFSFVEFRVNRDNRYIPAEKSAAAAARTDEAEIKRSAVDSSVPRQVSSEFKPYCSTHSLSLSLSFCIYSARFGRNEGPCILLNTIQVKGSTSFYLNNDNCTRSCVDLKRYERYVKED